MFCAVGAFVDGRGTVTIIPAALDAETSRLLPPPPSSIFVAGELVELWIEAADRCALCIA